MIRRIKKLALVATALASGVLFAYNGGYENALLTDTTIGGTVYKGYGNVTVSARTESGTSIAANAYAQCKKLKSVDLTGVTTIGNAAFAYSALETLTLPATVTSLGYIAFGGCTNLTTVTVNGFGWYKANTEPFRDCTKLTTLVANCAPPSIDATAFKTLFLKVTTVRVPDEQVAAWSAKGYDVTVQSTMSRITFSGNGGTVSGKQFVVNVAKPGNLFGKLATAALSGQIFEGWYTAAKGGTKINSSTTVPSVDTTYYAHYTPRLSLAKAFLNSGITAAWETDSWAGQSAETSDGVAAARCGYVNNNDSSYLRTTVTGPGTVTFKWKVSCESAGNDAVRFLVDGTEKKYLSGERDWTAVTISVYGAGTHTLTWNYTKNATVTKGDDYAWVDEVKWLPAVAGSRITFSGNGGTVSGKQFVVNVAKPGNLFGKLATAALSGQIFEGWYTAAKGGTKINSSTTVPSVDTTYYAHYTPRLSLAKAFLNSGITAAWETDSWAGQSAETSDGVAAARCGYVNNNGSSYLRTTVTGPGTVTFKWKVSCESAGNDAVRFLVDGTEKKYLSGERDWTAVTISVYGAGTHTLTWNYTKNATVTKGDDYAWVDEVKWLPAVAISAATFSPTSLDSVPTAACVQTVAPKGCFYDGVLVDGGGRFVLFVHDDGVTAWLSVESASGTMFDDAVVAAGNDAWFVTTSGGLTCVIRDGVLEW